jgi:hypothetical protein
MASNLARPVVASIRAIVAESGFAMKNLLWLPLVFALSACAPLIYTTFEEPVEGDRARVRLVAANDDEIAFARAIPGRDHIDWEAPGAGVVFSSSYRWLTLLVLVPPPAKGFSRRSLGMPPGPAKGDFAEFYVKAGEPLTLVANGRSMGTGRYHTECTETIIRHQDRPDETSTECSDVESTEVCNRWRSFTPVKNMDYELAYSRQNAWNCRLDLYTLGAWPAQANN